MREEFRQAWRSLRQRRLTSVGAVLCLAVGIGANTALFGVLNALVLRAPAGVANADEVVRVRVGQAGVGVVSGAGPSVTYPVMQQAAARLADVAEVAAYAPRAVSLGRGAGAERAEAIVVTPNYFEVLGVRPRHGRFFTAAEGVAGGGLAGVVSYAAWQRRFGADAALLGRVLDVNGAPVTVIGVAPAGFVGVDHGTPDLWLTTAAAGLPALGGPQYYTDRVYWLQMVARRRSGVPAASLAAVAEGRGTDPYSAEPQLPLHVLPLRAMFFAEQRGQNPVPPWVLGITATLLLLACATVANLLLMQGIVREREIAVRLALGATRGRIVRQLLAENVLIAVCAAAAALLFAHWSGALVRLLPLPPLDGLVDVRVAVFSLTAALATVLLFGTLPAVWSARGALDAVLRRGAASMSPRQSAVQRALTAGQLALTFVLLVSAALFLASFRSVSRVATGIDVDRLLTVSIDARTLAPTPVERRELYERTLERLARVPGVAAVATSSILPFYLLSRSGFTIPDGRAEEEQPLSELVSVVSTDFFSAAGVRFEAGRAFDAADGGGAAPVAIVSATLARRYWPDGRALGACIRLRGRHADGCVRVIGITAELRLTDLVGDPSAVLFLHAAQDPPEQAGAPTVLVRTAGPPGRLVEQVRRAAHSVDRRLPFIEVRPLDERLRPSRIPWEVGARLFTTFALLATVLGSLGLASLTAFSTRRRLRDLGIRAALGADARHMVQLVLSGALRVALYGIGAGIVLAAFATRLIAHRLHGITALDAGTYTAVALLLLVVAVAAAWLPARTAAAADPLVTLRQE